MDIGGRLPLRIITQPQPWASLIVTGAKTVVSMPRPASHLGEVGIHAGTKVPPWMHQNLGRDATLRSVAEHLDGFDPTARDLGLPASQILATAVVVASVPVGEVHFGSWGDDYRTDTGWRRIVPGPVPLDERVDDTDPRWRTVVAEHERHLGWFASHEWVWLLDDVTPIAERCPACWGETATTGSERGRAACWVCDGFGRCDLRIGARSRGPLWTWTPDRFERWAT